MSGHRWMKFWPQDWKNDASLRLCSYAARGLWMELLALMHDAEPYGHLLVNGRAPTPRQVAALTGGAERDVVKLLAELEEAGVFSRSEDGVIFSRRMVRDRAVSEAGKHHGSKGGNPKLKGEDNPSGSGDRKGEGLTPPLKLQDTEAESESDTSLRSVAPRAAARRGTRLPDDWLPAAAEHALAVELGLDLLRDVLPRFRDYWRAKPGAGGIKLDWNATLRNWLRSEGERRGGARGKPAEALRDTIADLMADPTGAGRSRTSQSFDFDGHAEEIHDAR